MSLLDDLKKQAESLRQQQVSSDALFSQNLLAVHDRLKEALLYWVDMFNSLNVIKPVVTRTYYLDGGNATLDPLSQFDYNVNGRRKTVDHHDYIEGIVLRMRCTTDGALTVEKESSANVERMREHLWSHNIKFDLKEYRNDRGYLERGLFTIPRDVAVMVTIVGDLERGQIQMHTKNLEKLGEAHYLYDIAEFTREINEELAKMILGKPNQLRALGRHQQAARPAGTAGTASRFREAESSMHSAAPVAPPAVRHDIGAALAAPRRPARLAVEQTPPAAPVAPTAERSASARSAAPNEPSFPLPPAATAPMPDPPLFPPADLSFRDSAVAASPASEPRHIEGARDFAGSVRNLLKR